MLRILPPMFEPVLQEIRLRGLNREKNKKNSVRGLYDRKQHVIELFTSDVIKKSIVERLVYAPSDLSPRFTCRKVM